MTMKISECGRAFYDDILHCVLCSIDNKLCKKEVRSLQEYQIYAGLSGGFNGPFYCGTHNFINAQEAENYARLLAIEEYESYGGHHGLYTWESMRQEIADEEYDGDIEAVDPDQVSDALLEDIEGWIVYEAIPVNN